MTDKIREQVERLRAIEVYDTRNMYDDCQAAHKAADTLEKLLAVYEAAVPVRDSIMSEVKTVTGTEACNLDDALAAVEQDEWPVGAPLRGCLEGKVTGKKPGTFTDE